MRREEQTPWLRRQRRKAAGQAASGKASAGIKLLHDHLLARAPQEDLAGYRPADLESAVAIAHEAVAAHLPGTSVIDIRTEPGIASTGGRCR